MSHEFAVNFAYNLHFKKHSKTIQEELWMVFMDINFIILFISDKPCLFSKIQISKRLENHFQQYGFVILSINLEIRFVCRAFFLSMQA